MLGPGDKDRKPAVVPACVDVGEVSTAPGKPVFTRAFTWLFGTPKEGPATRSVSWIFRWAMEV